MTDCDIFIAGGGVAGLIAAAAFGQAGFKVICVDPAPPVTEREAEGADLRSTAFLQPAKALLEATGIWLSLQSKAQPLQVMRIVDAGGSEPVARMMREFDASDISEDPFGWNLPNWLIRREVMAFLNRLEGVEFRAGERVEKLFTREAEAHVTLSGGARIMAQLVVAADGRHSTVRQAAGIGVKTVRYGQKALAFAVTHPIPHENVSTEIHRSGGPFTLVPLPDHEGCPSSAVVWMEEGPEVARLAALAEPEFEAAMSVRSCHLFGPLKLASRRSVWPIISQRADRMTAERVALIAEAAHVVPPIGAQGLNMSLGDLQTLLDLACTGAAKLGSAEMLDVYNQRRHPEILARVTGVDLLNRASMAQAQPLRDARALGLNALHALTPVRRALMQLGLGSRG